MNPKKPTRAKTSAKAEASKTKPVFKPSAVSRTPSAEQALATLRYARKAIDLIERYVDQQSDMPPWALSKIGEAGAALGMAVTYLRRDQLEGDE